jgi:hypothetical protein
MIRHVRNVFRVLPNSQRLGIIGNLNNNKKIFLDFIFIRIDFSVLTAVNFPLDFSNSAWYLAFDWSFVFSAMRFSSGVSAIVVAFALGMCLNE